MDSNLRYPQPIFSGRLSIRRSPKFDLIQPVGASYRAHSGHFRLSNFSRKKLPFSRPNKQQLKMDTNTNWTHSVGHYFPLGH